jgi:HD superfamily phosphohydrolase YqeK
MPNDTTHVQLVDNDILHQKIAAALTLLNLVPDDAQAVDTAALLHDTLKCLRLEVRPRA